MKKSIPIILLLLFLSIKSFAQRKGYKEIEIGKTINDINKVTKFDILIDKSNPHHYLVKGDTLKICDKQIDHIVIVTDENEIVDSIFIYTKVELFEKESSYWDDLRGTISRIINTVGKPVYNNLTTGPNHLLVGWEFDDAKTIMILRADNVSSFEKNFSRNYLICWYNKNSENNKMW